ncbi:hypothetical protein BDF20DRAFT_949616 [Mycotypha africana]|uniref:uncharacterized protein n=1 Tax=Mycotypha africana TaxID=64632 RepID=UPI0022FFE9AA|nr:uncharacterized protein BDF20DRAFT_949616 [Mycotypha africana]KAI8991022.1 hypothetical protein BDF20DRAFT_949616 [Mycotypha africana]
MFEDGVCKQINQLNDTGWKTPEDNDWVYYPQQYVNVSMTEAVVSFAFVGGCCAPNRYKDTGFLYKDDGSTYAQTGNKIVAIADRPLSQNITVTGWYMKKFVDDHAMNLTVIPSIHHPDKQSIMFEIVAFDRAMMVNYQFFDYQDKLIGKHSSGVMRNKLTIPDITLPRYTRRIVKIVLQSYNYVQFNFMAQELILCASHIYMLVFTPVRFLSRTPSHKVLMCIIIMLGSFIFNQAWNMINSQSSMFHDWLPRAVKIIGILTTCTLFGLRLSLDLPSYVITYARSLPFLIINVLAAIPTAIAYCIVLLYFITRYITFQPLAWFMLSDILWKKDFYRLLVKPMYIKKFLRRLFGLHEFVRIPFAIKTSITLLLYCLAQLIPLLLTQMIGVGGIVPVYICSWSPYLSQFQYHPQPMEFAIKTFLLMQIAVYISALGAGGCFTGTLYFMLEISFIGTLITLLIQLDRLRDVIFQRVGYGVYFTSFLIAFLVQMVQKRITNLIFIENRTRFNIHHRAPFLHYWYFMMLTSMTRALTSYILRTLKLLFRYPLFSLRVDRNAETWSVRRGDGGFTAYCGMLLAEHYYNNPVVLVFLECLLDSIDHSVVRKLLGKDSKMRYCYSHKNIKEKRKQDLERQCYTPSKGILMPSSSATSKALGVKGKDLTPNKRARFRWFLAYTMINNPGVGILYNSKTGIVLYIVVLIASFR